MSTLSSKYQFDRRKPRLTHNAKIAYEQQFDLINLSNHVLNSTVSCCLAPDKTGIYFVIDKHLKAFYYIGSGHISTRIKTHLQRKKFNSDNVFLGWLLMSKNSLGEKRSIRRVEEYYILRYKPTLNIAIKDDEYRKDYSFCWCGELLYSHDLCLSHFEKFVFESGCVTPKNYTIQSVNLSNIKNGIVVTLVHQDTRLTLQKENKVFKNYSNTARNYYKYVSQKQFSPGQIQLSKTNNPGVLTCCAMILSSNFRFVPRFEHAAREDYECLTLVLNKIAVAAKQKNLPVYIPHSLGQDYGMCWHYIRQIIDDIFISKGISLYVYL